MLSKLLSNIRAENNSSGGNDLNGKGGQEGKLKSSGQVFKSLLQALQSNGESGKGKQALLTLSDDTKEESNISNQVLGGSFSELNGGIEGEKAQKSKEEILEELQKEFGNLKNQLLAEGKKTTSEEGQKKTGGKKQDGDNSSSNEQINGGKKIAGSPQTGTLDTSKGNRMGEAGKVEKAASESKQTGKNPGKNNIAPGKAITAPGTNSSGADKASGEDSSKSQQPKGESSKSQVQAKDVDTNVITDKAGSKSLGQEDGKKVANKGIQSRSSRASNANLEGGAAAKESSQFGLSGRGDKEMPATDSKKKAQKQPPLSNGALQSQKRVDDQRIPLENVRSDAKGAISANMIKKPESAGEVKSHITIREPLSGSTSQSETGQTVKTEFSEQQKKVIGAFGNKNTMTNLSAKGLEVKNPQAQKGEKGSKSKNRTESKTFGFSSESSQERNELLKRLGISRTEAPKKATPFDFTGGGISAGDSGMNLKEQVINWEEQVAETLESGKEQESKASFGAASTRLGQMPIANVSLRKKILPGLTQRIKQAASSAKQDAGNWQKHNFTLDDGKNIQLSVRESKGVLQVKMGSLNLDLSKLLQQNLQQIREHMRQEFGTEVDLQFDNQQGKGSQHSDDTDSSERKRNYRTNLGGEGLAAENVEDISSKTVRNFGYNQMEWTA